MASSAHRLEDEGRVGPFRVGQRLAEAYELTSILGVGGMGVVYEARDVILLRRVAIKAPRYPFHAKALRAEAQALTAIRNPAFVTVFHVGHQDGVEFMVMERLFGDTLEARLDEARARGLRLSLSEALELLIAVAEALSAAHAVGIAQRDLKPSNIVICGHRVVLVDLGLFVPEVLVAPGNIAGGSAGYVAPEVLLRAVQRGNGPLIDLYALGILAFELLTNVTPYAADSLGQMLANHVGARIPDVRELRPDVPPELARLLIELLAKDPNDRPASAEAVLWQLKNTRIHGARRLTRLVLAVDEGAPLGRTLKRTLEAAFPNVLVELTTEAPGAVPSSHRAAPDLVLVDLEMRTQDGVEVCRKHLSLPRDRRPVVVGVSALLASKDIAALRTLGMRHFVPKAHGFVAAMTNVITDLDGARQPCAPR